ncbi:hypothetical protein TKK_0000004 [Trichogramma kaykai]|uniref:C2H2-type domain-containing protein n=1 Tax=Trichogramma kaykai TaxID=54128 RepID=A0ABD2VUX6_9HYME
MKNSKENTKNTKEEMKNAKEKMKNAKEKLKNAKEEKKNGKEQMKNGKKQMKNAKEKMKDAKEEIKNAKEEMKNVKEKMKNSKEKMKKPEKKMKKTKEKMDNSIEKKENSKEKMKNAKEKMKNSKEKMKNSGEKMKKTKEKMENSKEKKENSKEKMKNSKEKMKNSKEIMKNPEEKKEEVICTYCKATFPNRHEMLVHYASEHEYTGPKHRCNWCYEFFPTLRKLKKHKLTNHKAKTLKCDECYKKFVSITLFQIHKAMHKKKYKYECLCETCEKIFPSRKIMTNHKCPMDKAPELFCDLCGVSHIGEGDFYKHRMQCHPEDLYNCEICSNLAPHAGAFCDKKALAYHIRDSHIKVYECDKCFAEFGNKRDLAVHCNSLHKQQKCPSCDEVFESFRLYVDHRDEVHGGEVYRCDRCKKIYSAHYNLRLHKANCTAISCPLCDEVWGNETDMWLHMHGTHGPKARCSKKISSS